MNTRRTVIRSAAWAVPAVTIAAAAPAFATSHVGNSVRCYWKEPGAGKNTMDYYVGGENIAGVTFTLAGGGTESGTLLLSNEGGYAWGIRNLEDSRSPQSAVVRFDDNTTEVLDNLFLPYTAACKA